MATTCNLGKALEAFGAENILEKDAIVGDQIGTVFFAPSVAWKEEDLKKMDFPMIISDHTFNYSAFGYGWAVFVPDN